MSHFLQRLPYLNPVIKRNLLLSDDLVILMALACYQNRVFGPGQLDGHPNGLSPIGNLQVSLSLSPCLHSVSMPLLESKAI